MVKEIFKTSLYRGITAFAPIIVVCSDMFTSSNTEILVRILLQNCSGNLDFGFVIG